MNLDPYIEIVIKHHSEFSPQEVQEICEEYISRFNKKTKEATKEKSLKKYLSKEFALNFEEELKNHDEFPVKSNAFDAIPKYLFQSTQNHPTEYLLRLSELSKQLGKTILFEEANLDIKYGAKIALVGKNGAGKSTLLKVLIGEEIIEHGDLEISKNIKIWFLSQDLFWERRDRIVKEEMLTALPQLTQNMHRLKKIEELLEVGDPNAAILIEEQSELNEWMVHHNGYIKYDLQTKILKYFWFSNEQLGYKISQLSGWEQTKLQIARFLLQEVDLLILDEPTNHLDIEWIMFLEHFCQLRGKTLICISHDKKFLNRVFGYVTEITNMKLENYQGNYDSFLQQKQKKYEIQLKNHTTQQKYFKQQKKFIEKFRYKASKASQVQSRIKMLNKIDKIELPENDTTAKTITFKLGKRLPNKIMEFDQLSVGYGSTILVNLPPRLEINKNMRIGIIGKNGVGKTTLLKTILWQLPALYGGFEIHPDMHIGSYSQVAEELNREASIIEEILWPGISNREVRSLLGSLLIDNEKMDQKIATLSGGERAKVALTKMLLSKPDIIIMDEPTNHLDIPSKAVIKAMLTEFDGVSLIVSHDRDFLEGTSNLLRTIIDQQLTVFHNLEKGFETLEAATSR